MELFLRADTWMAFITLCLLEIILGIDNIVFISILSNKLPKGQRGKARNIGLLLAIGVRTTFLLGITWVMGLTATLFTIPENFIINYEIPFSIRDLTLFLGGLFLITKSTTEMNNKMESRLEIEKDEKEKKKPVSLLFSVIQIALIDIIFSFDSILTAVGMVEHVSIMIAAVTTSILIMMVAAKYISQYILNHPSMEVLALGFLLLIGFLLLLDALHQDVPKGYIYFAISFSLFVESINIRVRKKKKVKTPPGQLQKVHVNKAPEYNSGE